MIRMPIFRRKRYAVFKHIDWKGEFPDDDIQWGPWRKTRRAAEKELEGYFPTYHRAYIMTFEVRKEN